MCFEKLTRVFILNASPESLGNRDSESSFASVWIEAFKVKDKHSGKTKTHRCVPFNIPNENQMASATIPYIGINR